jgi:hypothetical protein
MSDKRYRLSGYNYSKARAYMATLKMHPQAAPLSILAPTYKGGLKYTPLTKVFKQTIAKRLVDYFCKTVSVKRYILMPNHIHLVIYLNRVEGRPPANLIRVVETLIKFLNEAYFTIYGEVPFAPVDTEWDDSIAFTREAYQRMLRYVEQNPTRANLRQASRYCKHQSYLDKSGVRWWVYGNLDLVKRPTILSVECSRKITPSHPLWTQWQQCAQRMTVGCVGIGTFMSPCEKMVQSTLLAVGGSVIIHLPHGISPYWHPGETMEQLCAEGRVLYLTPFAFEAAQPSNATLYQRCHKGGELKTLMEKLACNIAGPPRE